MTRDQLQQEIANLDRQINAELSKTRVPSLSGKHSSFPTANWILTALVIGWSFAGASIPMAGDYYEMTMPYAQWAGYALAGLAVLRTILWVVKLGGGKSTSKYKEATEHVKTLQDKRRELQKQLEEIKKAGG